MGNNSEFMKATRLIIENVSFDKDSTVQVFEANIRLLGALLSAHLLIVDSSKPFGDLKPNGYTRELLDLAHDLATRLLPAFENTFTGLPYPRVNLRYGVPNSKVLFVSQNMRKKTNVDCVFVCVQDCEWCLTHTCTAGAGSLLLEFGMLSRLLGDPIYETVARRAAKALWLNRAKGTGLLGNVIDVETGEWIGNYNYLLIILITQ